MQNRHVCFPVAEGIFPRHVFFGGGVFTGLKSDTCTEVP